MISLLNAPYDKKLRIVGILGGHGIRRRLLSLGFCKNHIIALDSKSIFRGPVLIRDMNNETSVALGRGIAKNIMVEVVEPER
jgi:Fe2+ transport system protein FeoA